MVTACRDATVPDSRADEYLAKARLADEQAAIAPTMNLARQWRGLADTYRIIADALRCPVSGRAQSKAERNIDRLSRDNRFVQISRPREILIC